MTRRLYYTCPIKAAYMAKEFGVGFHSIDYLKMDGQEILNFTSTVGERISHHAAGMGLGFIKSLKIYVQKVRSESIFEPKQLDLGVFDEGSCKFCKEFKKLVIFYDYGGWCDPDDDEPIYTEKKIEIIMRDNKHFFMPNKCENTNQN